MRKSSLKDFSAMSTDTRPDGEDEIVAHARRVVEHISDPELPMLTIVDLGILREIVPHRGGVEVFMLPTYPGCPALDMIALEIGNAITAAGIFPVKITMVTHPVWSSDLISPDSLQKLAAAGWIATAWRPSATVCSRSSSPSWCST